MNLNLPKLQDLEVTGKKVLMRADLDVGKKLEPGDDLKLSTLLPTLNYLVEKSAGVIVIGHRGRPKGVYDKSLSLEPVSKKLGELLEQAWGKEKVKQADMHMMENLRFDAGEEANDEHFAEHLAEKGDIYVNEAFSTSHRKHASFVALPLQFKTKSKNSVAAGFHFLAEVENISKVFEKPKEPVIVIISGVKKDKLDYIEELFKFADKVLIAGRLPEYMKKSNVKSQMSKVIIADLTPDKNDITNDSIEKFETEIAKAGTIVVSGPIGKYEDKTRRQGTERIFKAVANSTAFKLAGGGDTEQAIEMFNLRNKFDWVSVGGGAMLEFLAKGTLPGIKALLN